MQHVNTVKERQIYTQTEFLKQTQSCVEMNTENNKIDNKICKTQISKNRNKLCEHKLLQTSLGIKVEYAPTIEITNINRV